MADDPVGIDLSGALGVQGDHLEVAEVGLTDGIVFRTHVVDVGDAVIVKVVFTSITPSVTCHQGSRGQEHGACRCCPLCPTEPMGGSRGKHQRGSAVPPAHAYSSQGTQHAGCAEDGPLPKHCSEHNLELPREPLPTCSELRTRAQPQWLARNISLNFWPFFLLVFRTSTVSFLNHPCL